MHNESDDIEKEGYQRNFFDWLLNGVLKPTIGLFFASYMFWSAYIAFSGNSLKFAFLLISAIVAVLAMFARGLFPIFAGVAIVFGLCGFFAV